MRVHQPVGSQGLQHAAQTHAQEAVALCKRTAPGVLHADRQCGGALCGTAAALWVGQARQGYVVIELRGTGITLPDWCPGSWPEPRPGTSWVKAWVKASVRASVRAWVKAWVKAAGLALAQQPRPVPWVRAASEGDLGKVLLPTCPTLGGGKQLILRRWKQLCGCWAGEGPRGLSDTGNLTHDSLLTDAGNPTRHSLVTKTGNLTCNSLLTVAGNLTCDSLLTDAGNLTCHSLLMMRAT